MQNPEKTGAQPTKFALDVEINGFPFNFVGTLPESPTKARWELRPQGSKLAVGWLTMTDSRDTDTLILDTIVTSPEITGQKGYENFRGLGSFLLDNLLTFTDTKHWSVRILPLDLGGPMTDSDLIEWYKRHGFEDNARQPKTPDKTTAIARLL